MAKAEWGSKRTCPTCGAHFYDMRRETIACPVCDAVFDPERLPKARRGSSAVREDKPAPAPARKAAPKKDAGELDGSEPDVEPESNDEADEAEEADTEEGDLIEDTSELGEDEDDIGEVLEHVDNDEDKP